MVGRIKTPGGREATIGDDGVWASADADFALLLNAGFDPRGDRYRSPAKGFFGRAAVIDAAAALGGTYELTKVPEEKD
jgi:hypothetical protein